MTAYIKKYEKMNFSVVDLNISGVAKIGGKSILDLIDESSDQYVLPNDIILSNLTVEKVKSIDFPE